MLWLDAGRLNAARKALGRPEATDGAKVDLVRRLGPRPAHDPDASGAQPCTATAPCGSTARRATSSGPGWARFGRPPSSSSPRLRQHGGFRAFMAMNQEGKDDFTSGLTMDMGFGFSSRFETLNVEGNGFGGMANLMAEPSEFGVVRRMTVTSTPGPGGTKVHLEGRPGRSRDRKDTVLVADRVTVGARRYAGDAARGFLDGDIMQVLVYDRVLGDAERTQVEGYLAARYGGKAPIVRPGRPVVGKPLVAVRNPPAVQMLVPGFSARELPVDLSNINNIKYRPDGKLVALAYDGNIYLLSDSKGSGLEDKAERFWENKGGLNAPIGMALTPPGYHLGEGVFVASKGRSRSSRTSTATARPTRRSSSPGMERASARRRRPGRGPRRGGQRLLRARGDQLHEPLPRPCVGRAAYDLKGEHGTIQKVSPDFGKREIIATGIRFPVALAFNRLGDLFATDQEGRPGSPTGTRSTSCCTSGRGGTTVSRRGTRSTSPRWSTSPACSTTPRSISRPAASTSTSRSTAARPSARPPGRGMPWSPATRGASSTGRSWRRPRPATSRRRTSSPP
ncbi:MAG: hypothetical protein WKF75_09050 [Singulisphaera sp.]